MSMNFIFRLFILFSLSLSFSVVYADEVERQRIVDAVKKYGIDEKGYLSGDGKSRYFATYDFGKDGGVDLKFKKSYLPAVTDGINRDKTSKFRIPPSAKKTAKYFAKGANHAMFLSMIIDVLGDSVDYVLDEQNNSVTFNHSLYRNPEADRYLVTYKVTDLVSAKKVTEQFFKKLSSNSNVTVHNCNYSSSGTIFCTYNDNRSFPFYFHGKEQKVMNDEEFAQAVIELAKADNAKAKKVVLDVAKQAVSDGDYDKEIQKAVDELNADETKDDTQDNQDNTSDSSNASSNSTNTDSQDDTQATPNNNNGGNNNNNNKFELPGFCDWAKPVCRFIEWFKTEPDYPDSELPEKDISIKSPFEFDKDYVKANAQCPPDIVVPFNTGFSSHELVFNLTPICDFVRIYLSKVVLIMAYVFATLHISSAFKV